MTLDQLERPEWIELSVTIFTDKNCMGRRIFPSGDLLGKKRTWNAIEKAMDVPLKTIACFRWKKKILADFAEKNIMTIGDFLSWNVSDAEYEQIEERYIKGIADAFAEPLLILPHNFLLTKIFGERPQHQIDKEDLIRSIVGEWLLTLNPRDAVVIVLLYGLYSGLREDLQTIGKKCNISKERVRQIEARAIRKLRHPSNSRELRQFFP